MTLPPPPAHVAPYVRVLGIDGAVEFLLTFGGSEVYWPANAKGRSRVAEHLGRRRAEALAAEIGTLKSRVPTAKPWIASVWHAKGLPVAEIARRLHVTDVTVRAWKRAQGSTRNPDPRQMRLF